MIMSTDELPAATPCELRETLAFTVPAECLGFATTDDIHQDGDWVGQERALASLELGLRVRHPGFNIYVCGLEGTHRDRVLADLLRRFTADQPTPGDRVLVQNFCNPDRPRALYLPAGWGVRLRQDMRELIDELRRVLPKTLREETFEEEKERLSEQFGEQGETITRQLTEHAAKANFALQPGSHGEVVFIPLKDGRPMKPEEMEALSEPEQAELRRREREIGREIKAVFRQQRLLFGRLTREVKAAERRTAAEAIAPLIAELAERYPQDGVQQYLGEVRERILDHLGDFQEHGPPQVASLPPFWSAGQEDDWRLDYEVNVLVDNSTSQGAPIIVESSPTYKNVFGAVERMVDRFGKLVTNFTRVTAGSLLRAHGGCIIINVLDALSEPLVWRALKRAFEKGQLDIETPDPFALFTTSALKPEPMAFDTRVVLTGPTEVFQLLYSVDDEFSSIFKVRADFGGEADGDAARRNFIAQVARIAHDERLPPFTAESVARLIEFGARSVGDRRKLPSQWSELGDIMREAAFWAAKRDHGPVTGGDVEHAITQRSFRLNRVEAKIREMIRDKVLLVDVEGQRVGQVNALAVTDIAGYDFGRPLRITAAVSMGAQGVIAVDREAKMSGKSYDKAVLIITGYLRRTYAQDFPLTLSASLSFEQSYSGIEGDSASAAELFALISSLSGIPLRQDVAVTGSVNQFGDIQPIGAVNEKVEGAFYTCREIGLTGRQGVVIPVQNVDSLIVCRDVVAAVREGQFHIYPVRTLDEGLEVLTGVKAGSVCEPGTIHYKAAQRLRQLADGLRRFGAPLPPLQAAADDESGVR
jgi:lon-related putative ATP-dependent protease